MIKQICMDCNLQFETPAQKEVADTTGFDGIHIEVCPVCLSNHIQPIKGLYTPILDQTEINTLAYMCEAFVTQLANQKVATNDMTLKEYYTAHMMGANDLVKKIMDKKNA